MEELWTTVAARLHAMLEPARLLDVGGTDEGFTSTACKTAAAWDGKVVAVRPKKASARRPANLEVRTPYAAASVVGAGRADLVVLHGKPDSETVAWQLAAVAGAADAAEARIPPIVVGHAGAQATPRTELINTVEGFATGRELEVIWVLGLGGVALISDWVDLASWSAPARALVGELRLLDRDHALSRPGLSVWESRGLRDQLRALHKRVGALSAELTTERARADRAQIRASRLEELRYDSVISAQPPEGIGESAGAAPNGKLSDEPTRALVREILHPAELLRALGWPGGEEQISLPIPVDRRGAIDRSARHSLVLTTDGSPLPLRRTLCSVLDRAAQPVALTLATPGSTGAAFEKLMDALEIAIPSIELVDPAQLRPRPGAQRLVAGEELPWGWPEAYNDAEAPSVAYLVPGMPHEGSGGVNSVVQEARGLRSLGAQASVCVPFDALERAERLYGNGDSLFVPYLEEAGIVEAVGDATVAVATEHTSLPLLARLARGRPDIARAYYVQDYEPLFAELGSARSDRALLSYAALPDATLFAKTHFICNLVSARHGVRVAKVRPSLDRSVFNDSGRGEKAGDRLTVLAMLRPRTPRRRPRATLTCLSLINDALAEKVELVTFGCDRSELDAGGYGGYDELQHLGPLSSEQVAEQLRRSDVFIDGSAYQAFGRSGLEAMACGAVPVLPSLGGVSEYAADGENAIVLDDDSPGSLAGAVIELAGDRDRLERLRTAALSTAGGFSVERAAQSQLELFRFLHASRSGRAERAGGTG